MRNEALHLQRIAGVAKRFLNADVDCAAVLLRDQRLCRAVRMRKPVVPAYPRSQITCSIVALAAKLSKGLAVQPNGDGFFRKVVDWFF